jgi:cell division septation protein DedD
MRNKEFREIQVSSSALVFIFLAILILGVFIFLLGVSVGKKQAQMSGPTALLAERQIQNVAPSTSIPSEDKDTGVPVQHNPDEIQAGSKTETDAALKTADSGLRDKAEVEVRKTAERTAPAETKPPASKTSDSGTASLKAGAYFIQVAAFNEKTQANALASRFKRQGYSVIVLDPFPTDRKAIYRVRIGGYATREQALQALSKLNAAAKKKTGYYITKD